MFNYFLSGTHERRFNEFIGKDGGHFNDIERCALFYIIAGHDVLTRQIERLYNFENRCILPNIKEVAELPLSSSERSLVRLGYNLFNGYTDIRSDLVSIMHNLDSYNCELAIQAIEQRFNPNPRSKPKSQAKE